jgi:hypothetical protein
MSSRRSFLRKIVYLLAIGVLLIPLHWLSHPATEAAKGAQGSPGGKLARLRTDYHLSQAQLGEVDPTSVTIKLATLGMRGLAAEILWTKAIDYKMKKDWTNFGGTLNQITKIQPNFLNIWVNQAWNVSYNISVEFDDYRERYRWVIKGFKFLQEGMKYNEGQPKLPWELGRFVSQKIGKADEVKQYRRLFAADSDYRESLPPDLRDTCLDFRGRPDNWLLGKGWYDKAVDMIESLGRKATVGQSPLMYYSGGPLCQMYYADMTEKEGTFGEVAKTAWMSAAKGWRDYGDKRIPCTLQQPGSDEPLMIRLNDKDAEENAAKKALAELEKLQPGLRNEIIAAKKKNNLTPAQRRALDVPLEKRTGREFELAAQAQELTQVTHEEVALKVSDPKRKELAKRLAKQASQHELIAAQIRGSRNIVNFEYWRDRAATEQEQDIRDARESIYKGDRAFVRGDLPGAKAAYENGLNLWRKVLDVHKEYVADQTTCEDLMDMIKRYRHILSQRDEPWPKKFILQDVIDSCNKMTGEMFSPSPPSKKQEGKSQPGKPEAKKTSEKVIEAKKAEQEAKAAAEKAAAAAKKAEAKKPEAEKAPKKQPAPLPKPSRRQSPPSVGRS